MYGLTPICNILNWMGFRVLNPNDPANQIISNAGSVMLFFKSQNDPVETHCIDGNKHHFIADPNLIKPLLHKKREDEEFSFGQGPLIKKQVEDAETTMLTCPFSEHRRLRSPLETLFTSRHLRESKTRTEIAHHVVTTYPYTAMEPISFILENPSSSLPFFLILKTILGFEGDLAKMKVFTSPYINPKKRKLAIQELHRAYAGHLYEDGKGMDLLQQAQVEGKISEQEKIDTTVMLLIAGVHTSNSFLKNILGVMAVRADLREKIILEWNEFIKTYEVQFDDVASYCDWISLFAVGGKINGQNYSGSQWLSWTYYETVRTFPVIPVISRIANTKLSIQDRQIEKNEFVQLNIRAVQRDSSIWENPNEFKPERFENPKAHSELLTFGLGSQRCIGKDLIEVESKILVATLLTLFEWRDHTNKQTLMWRMEDVSYYDGLTDTTERCERLRNLLKPFEKMNPLITEANALCSPHIFVEDAEQLLMTRKSGIKKDCLYLKQLEEAEEAMKEIKSRNC